MNPTEVFEDGRRKCPVTSGICDRCGEGECQRIKVKSKRAYTKIEAVAPVAVDAPVEPVEYERTSDDLTKREPVEHELKIWPEPFHAIIHGKKRHEVRRFDRDFRVGDELVLREYDPARAAYTGDEARVRISYISAPGTYGLPRDLGVLSIEKAYSRVKPTPKAAWPFPESHR